jgi:hypothetical protein
MGQRYLPLAVIAIAFVLVLALLSGRPHMTPNADPWRRTAHGWEQTTDWQVSAIARPTATVTTARPRFDSHPAALALVQVVGTLLALYGFPVGASQPASGSRNWLDLLARSFRASAFGS